MFIYWIRQRGIRAPGDDFIRGKPSSRVCHLPAEATPLTFNHNKIQKIVTRRTVVVKEEESVATDSRMSCIQTERWYVTDSYWLCVGLKEHLALKIVLLVNNNKADAVRTENWDQHLVIRVDPRDELPLKNADICIFLITLVTAELWYAWYKHFKCANITNKCEISKYSDTLLSWGNHNLTLLSLLCVSKNNFPPQRQRAAAVQLMVAISCKRST